MPSSSSAGFCSIRYLSMYEPGSPSSPFATITFSSPGAARVNSPLTPPGNAGPPAARTRGAPAGDRVRERRRPRDHRLVVTQGGRRVAEAEADRLGERERAIL